MSSFLLIVDEEPISKINESTPLALSDKIVNCDCDSSEMRTCPLSFGSMLSVDDCETRHCTPTASLLEDNEDREYLGDAASACCSSESVSTDCCQNKGIPFCCEAFEKRIFQWVELNIPSMVNAESKMESFFDSKKSNIRLLKSKTSIILDEQTVKAPSPSHNLESFSFFDSLNKNCSSILQRRKTGPARNCGTNLVLKSETSTSVFTQ